MNKILITNNSPVNTPKKQLPPNNIAHKQSFSEVLDIILNNQDIKFSKHALQRLESRKITLDQNEILRIKNALHKANQKGIRETLILMDNKAFVASVQNRTIITAALDEQLKESVFTNIDGAVII